jgi:hypothetical protein
MTSVVLASTASTSVCAAAALLRVLQWHVGPIRPTPQARVARAGQHSAQRQVTAPACAELRHAQARACMHAGAAARGGARVRAHRVQGDMAAAGATVAPHSPCSSSRGLSLPLPLCGAALARGGVATSWRVGARMARHGGRSAVIWAAQHRPWRGSPGATRAATQLCSTAGRPWAGRACAGPTPRRSPPCTRRAASCVYRPRLRNVSGCADSAPCCRRSKPPHAHERTRVAQAARRAPRAAMQLARHAVLPARRCVAPLRHRGARGCGAVSAVAARRCACSAAPLHAAASAEAALPPGTSVLFLSPVWPEWRSSAAGAPRPRPPSHLSTHACAQAL